MTVTTQAFNAWLLATYPHVETNHHDASRQGRDCANKGSIEGSEITWKLALVLEAPVDR
jgi:hypothetical protein